MHKRFGDEIENHKYVVAERVEIVKIWNKEQEKEWMNEIIWIVLWG